MKRKSYPLAIALLLTGIASLLYSTGIWAQSNAGTESFNVTVYPVENTSKIMVVVTKKLGKRFHLAVRDEKENIMIIESLPKRVVQHRFDLNLAELPNGKYYIDMWDGKEPTVTKIITKERTQLAIPIVADRILCIN